jgi:hypothetical protein
MADDSLLLFDDGAVILSSLKGISSDGAVDTKQSKKSQQNKSDPAESRDASIISTNDNPMNTGLPYAAPLGAVIGQLNDLHEGKRRTWKGYIIHRYNISNLRSYFDGHDLKIDDTGKCFMLRPVLWLLVYLSNGNRFRGAGGDSDTQSVK